jgi:hypothetical protein
MPERGRTKKRLLVKRLMQYLSMKFLNNKYSAIGESRDTAFPTNHR